MSKSEKKDPQIPQNTTNLAKMLVTLYNDAVIRLGRN